MYQPPQTPWNAAPPPPPGYGGGDGTAIAVTAKYWWLNFIYGLFKPNLVVDGRPVPAIWGRNVVPVPPGQHHVHVHVPYILPPRIGVAETVVPVYPGQVVEVEYRPPAIAWLGGSIGPAPQKVRGVGGAIALMIVPLVLLLCIVGGIVVAALNDDSGDPVARPRALPQEPFRAPTDEPETAAPETAAPGTAEPTASGKPTLRPVPARTLVGPAFAPGEDTYTMDFTGWPFAFRTPGTWGCAGGNVDLPDAKGWVCIDEGNPGSGQKVQIMLRPCPAPCGKAERDRLTKQWFDPGAKGKVFDERTTYVETPADAKGRYTLDMSHFFAAGSGGTPEWQVGIGAFTPPAGKADIQKIFNDVLTQTG